MSELVAVNGAVNETAPPKKASKINVTIKRSEHNVEIDMDKLTWQDAKKLRKYQAAIGDGTMTEDEAIKISDELIAKVIGQDPNDLPMEVVNRVMKVLFSDDAEAEADQGN